eukprot:TRINITY_DN45877_c0_g1_i1.p1 TRINITY_DN45877_c0_g1~~TRINITY_DN45877_c0_g1_i1.p1  ORF type:complete len:133 (+),score=21.67 TRINITY_DN45877_c0_g1_i1:311-709(+)
MALLGIHRTSEEVPCLPLCPLYLLLGKFPLGLRLILTLTILMASVAHRWDSAHWWDHTLMTPYYPPGSWWCWSMGLGGRGMEVATDEDAAAAAPLLLPTGTVSYTHLRAHETPEHLVCRLLLEKKKQKNKIR